MNPETAIKYKNWIEAFVSEQPQRFVRGKCAEATIKMVAEFPELRRACGFVQVTWGRDQHWWCVTPDGVVVDPTEEQFGPVGVLFYEELDLNNPDDVRRIPTGRCIACGEDVYEKRVFCSAACETAFSEDMGWTAAENLVIS